MGWRILGDSAWLSKPGGDDTRERLHRVLGWARLLEIRRIPEVHDIVSSFDTVAVHFSPEHGERVLAWLLDLPFEFTADSSPPSGPLIDIPVTYGGEAGTDLQAMAVALGRTCDEVIRLHSQAEYTVAAVGFSPGFPYLLGLPEALQIPRQNTPRQVPAGAVAIAGAQAGIYPFASMGGWHVIGHTTLPMFDLSRWAPALLRPGDRVRFMPNGNQETAKRVVSPSLPETVGGLEIVEPGALTSVQDLGRPGYQTLGVSPGGAADPVAARVANRLLGNPEDAAVLECCMQGPMLRFHSPTSLAVVGWSGPKNGRAMEFAAGETIDLKAGLRALRGYIAIAGGIDVPHLLGSRSTDLRACFGGWHGRTLQAGDRLPIGPLVPPCTTGHGHVSWPHRTPAGAPIELRFLRGVQSSWFSEKSLSTFRRATFHISPVSDRTGCRLIGPALASIKESSLVSQPVAAGSIQVPPDGQPIVLLAERQTIGGYPQIAHVISADLAKIARSWPGTPIRFREVDLETARNAWASLQKQVRQMEVGIDFQRGT